MPPSVNELECATECLAEGRGIVPRDRQAAASFRPIEREGRNDGVPADLYGSLKPSDIGSTITFLGKEMECCPIMPNVVSFQRLPDRSIRGNPANLCTSVPKASFSGRKRSFG